MAEFDLGKVVGADGRGIQSVELVSTVGKEKTYRITYTDGDYYEFTVKDGEDALTDIVTAWENTLSDNKVPSEKLTKNTIDTKVDKVTGKGLSTEDYTTSEKTKLAGIEDGANKITVDDDLSSTSMNPLTNRRTYRWLTLKADKNSLATVATTGDYDDLTDKPSIPSKTSDLTNDGDGTNPFLTQHQSLSGYLKTTDIVDDLTTNDPDKPLSARQGKILKDLIDSLMPTVASVTLSADKSVLSAYDSESATLTATVTNSQSAPVASETVTFYKGSTVLGTATTDNSGVATLSYSSAGTGDVTFTAEADSITSNNLSIEDCIRYDTASTDKSSSYTPVQIDSGGVVQSFSFDTDHYLLSNSADIFTGWVLSDNTDNTEISMDFKLAGANAFYQAVMGYFNGNTSYMVRARGDKKVQEYIFNYDKSATESTFYTHTSSLSETYYRLKLRRIGTTATVSIHTTDDTTLATHDITITPSSNGKLFFGFLSGNNRDILVKNIKVKTI